MFDTLIDIGAPFDCITPMIDFYKNARNGPRHSFFVDRYVGVSANDIERLLKRNGIEMWGIVFFEDDIAFDVKERQAAHAQYVLQQNGIPITAGAIADSPLHYGSPNVANGNGDGLLDAIDKWLDSLVRIFARIFDAL
jgi:hypothetical protein